MDELQNVVLEAPNSVYSLYMRNILLLTIHIPFGIVIRRYYLFLTAIGLMPGGSVFLDVEAGSLNLLNGNQIKKQYRNIECPFYRLIGRSEQLIGRHCYLPAK
jgi:hypothetical protein